MGYIDMVISDIVMLENAIWQDDRDRVVASEDRKRDQQNLEETQYLTREIASLRIALREVATRDFVRSELYVM